MFDLIVNPIAGGNGGKKMLKNIAIIEKRLREHGAEFTTHYSVKKGDATILTQSLIQNGATDIVAIGGDGTLHEVINGFSNFDKVSLGIIPCGTGNDFANALNLPLAPEKAVDVIMENQPKYTDYMQMPTVRGLNVIGMGIDVEVLKRYEKLKKKTKFGYTSSLIKTLFKFKCIDFNADFNGINDKYHSFIAAVANGSMFGGGIPICPKADVSDGKLNFIAVDAMNKLKLIGAFLKLKKGKILSLKQTHHFTTDEISVTSDIPYTVNVDGELYDNVEFKIKVIHDTLRIYRP